MKLSEVINQYVAVRRSLGQRFNKSAYELGLFCRHHGDVEVTNIDPERIRACLQSGRGPARFLHHKCYLLRGFFRFAVARGYLPESPLPTTVPREPMAAAPYIYSLEEVRRILSAIPECDDCRCVIAPTTFRVLFLLLYATGLRIGEALALTIEDVDLDESLLLVRQSKFYKTRLVPMGPDLLCVLREHVARRQSERAAKGAALLATRKHKQIRWGTVATHYRRVCRLAAVVQQKDTCRQPRLHDVRHTFAVMRLVSWYRSGSDVQRLLPKLATYLGHINLTGTQRYLTLTADVLQEANALFERYAMGEHDE